MVLTDLDMALELEEDSIVESSENRIMCLVFRSMKSICIRELTLFSPSTRSRASFFHIRLPTTTVMAWSPFSTFFSKFPSSSYYSMATEGRKFRTILPMD